MGDEYASKFMNNDFLTSLIVAEPCREAVHRFGHQTSGIPYPSQQEIATSLYCSTPDAICESAARLLFISVKWARNIPSFVNLPFRDQVILLEEGWRELFIMGAVQWNMPLEVAPLLAAAGMHVDNTPAERIVATMADIRMLQEISARFRSLQVGEAEFACLKAVVLFKSGELHKINIHHIWPRVLTTNTPPFRKLLLKSFVPDCKQYAALSKLSTDITAFHKIISVTENVNLPPKYLS